MSRGAATGSAPALSHSDVAAEGGLLERAAGYFVRPATPAAAEPATAVPRFAPRALVLGTATDAPPVAAALACALRARERTSAAVVAVRCPATGRIDAPTAGPARPAAARLAARLSARGLPSAGRGRLAWLTLPEDPPNVLAALRRAAAAVDVPLVTALTGRRSAALDELVDDQDLIVVVIADPQGPLARLALAGLASFLPPAVACKPLPAGPARLLALAGLAGPRLLDEPLRAAVRSWR